MLRRGVLPVLTSLAMLLASACGSTTPDRTAATPSPTVSVMFPVTMTAANGAVTLSHRPGRIVSLSPSATEMLFTIGAGAQVVAVDDQSNYPPSAPMTKLSGFQPNVEAIAGYSPDLVVAADDTSGLVHGLEGLGIPILIEPAATDFTDSYSQIEQLGTATGHPAEAAALVKTMKTDIAAIVAPVPKPSHALNVYHELDDTYYSVTSRTFIGQVYVLLGLTNVADAASRKVPDYPQLSAEYIIDSNPDLIVLADSKCCHQDAQTAAARAGWSHINAVVHGEVVTVDDDIASRWGPRVVDFLRIVAQHVKEIEGVTPPSPTTSS